MNENGSHFLPLCQDFFENCNFQSEIIAKILYCKIVEWLCFFNIYIILIFYICF